MAYTHSAETKRKIRLGQIRRREELIQRIELVSNEPLRERYQTLTKYDPSNYTGGVIARRAGFVNRGNKPDTSHVQRLLGLREQTTTVKKGVKYSAAPAEYIGYDMAVKLCRAMDMDPVDAGV